ncbi:methyltransferase, partial [Campylobacter coli]
MQDSIKLAQLSDGYRYNSDSLLLADFVLEMGIKNQVLEVGSGCGICLLYPSDDADNMHEG